MQNFHSDEEKITLMSKIVCSGKYLKLERSLQGNNLLEEILCNVA